MTLTPIGVIRTSHRDPAATPIQPSRAGGAVGRVMIDEPYRDGLRDLDGFERIWLVYWFDRAAPASLLVTPFLDDVPHGVFATRAPSRPCPIGISAVRLLAIQGTTLEVSDIDILDGTLLLDIKPYVSEFDSYPASKAGWLEHSESRRQLGDGRFSSLDGKDITEHAPNDRHSGRAEP